MKGILILVVYAIVMLIVTAVYTKRENSVEKFCIGNRDSDFSKEDFLSLMTKGYEGYSNAEFITKI